MIRKLRLRMSLLVIGVLIAVSVGIVAGIYTMNNRNIEAQAEAALDVLAANSGHRPQPPEFRDGPFSEGENTPPPKPEEGSKAAWPNWSYFAFLSGSESTS